MTSGIEPDSGSTLRLDHVRVTMNSGVGILLGGAFDIRNTTVTTHGPGTTGAVTWGVLVNNPPAAGPKRLQLVTIQTNMGGGVACSAAIGATGALVSSNIVGGDVTPDMRIHAVRFGRHQLRIAAVNVGLYTSCHPVGHAQGDETCGRHCVGTRFMSMNR